mmetsp:Transcript_116596/g.202841  ORF Transcript_116596/g.202841 Transcript_116596/m.202841 type:complete len:109 (-) Transcript_116596:267-593(-)
MHTSYFDFFSCEMSCKGLVCKMKRWHCYFGSQFSDTAIASLPASHFQQLKVFTWDNYTCVPGAPFQVCMAALKGSLDPIMLIPTQYHLCFSSLRHVFPFFIPKVTYGL